MLVCDSCFAVKAKMIYRRLSQTKFTRYACINFNKRPIITLYKSSGGGGGHPCEKALVVQGDLHCLQGSL